MPKNNYLKSKRVNWERSSSLKWDMLSRYLELGLLRYIVGNPFEIAFQRNLNQSIRSSDEEIRAKTVKVRKPLRSKSGSKGYFDRNPTDFDRSGPLWISCRKVFGLDFDRSRLHFDRSGLNLGRNLLIGNDEFLGFPWIFHGLWVPKLGLKVPKHKQVSRFKGKHEMAWRTPHLPKIQSNIYHDFPKIKT